MRIEYVPFLKSKEHEVHAIAELDADVLAKVAPFFDFPRKQNGGYTPDTLAKAITRLVKKFTTHLSGVREFYFDTYDLDDDIEIDGIHLYRHLLDQFAGLPLIPVVSIDRTDGHLRSVVDAIKDKVVSSEVVAFRVTAEDFQSYDVVSDDLEDLLEPVFSSFKNVDLVFDCRICTGMDVETVSKQIDHFAKRFLSNYPVRRVVLAGSSIPASVADVLSSNSEEYVNRGEVEIYEAVSSLGAANYVFGDYTIISPDYSDANIPPEQMQGRITAKLIYSLDGQHYFIRGGSLKTKGREQYYDLAAALCSKDFYRGPDYSGGDAYFFKKSNREAPLCWVNTVIRPSIDAHITYAVNEL